MSVENEDARDERKCEQATPHRNLRKLKAIANPEAYQIDNVRPPRTSHPVFPTPTMEMTAANLSRSQARLPTVMCKTK
jgi:hypothetical protein